MKLSELKTFEGACKVLGLDPKKCLPDFYASPKKDQKALLAHAKLIIIVRAANKLANNGKEWKPDWNDGQWTKWYPWFWLDGGSSGFRWRDCAYQSSNSSVGSRLCFVSREAVEHVVKQKAFFKLYKEYFTM